MNFQFYIEKLSDSEEFKKFKSENPECYMFSGFFSIDKKGKDNQQHLDFYIPGRKEGFSFQLEKESKLIQLESYDERIPEKIDEDFDFDFNKIEKMIIEKMKINNVNKEIQKMLFSLQKLEGENFLLGTIFISGMGIIKAAINLEKNEITDFSRRSLFDMMKIIKK